MQSNGPISDVFWQRLVALRQLVFAAMQEGLSAVTELDLPVPQSVALSQLAEHGPMTVSQLQGVIKRSQATTSHLVNQLEGRRLVVRKDDASDGRRTVVHLSHQGQALIRKVERLRRQGFDEVLGHLPKSVLNQLDEALAAVLAAGKEKKP